jgi:hypothetical protein
LGPLERANLNHLKAETDPISETSLFLFSRIPDDRKKSTNPVILYAMHHRQNRIASTSIFTSRSYRILYKLNNIYTDVFDGCVIQ